MTDPGSADEAKRADDEGSARYGPRPRAAVVLTTVPSRDAARTLARELVERRLVACANVVPGVVSIYRWEGAVQEDDEVLIVLKTRRDRTTELAGAIRELHTYDTPEVVVLPVDGGDRDYLSWVLREADASPDRR